MLSMIFALSIIGFGYLCAIFEHTISFKKSLSMGLTGSLLWVCLPFILNLDHDTALRLYQHQFAEFCELFFFIFVAMTYVISLEHAGFFGVLKSFFQKHQFDTRSLFWIVTFLTFFLSPVLDNLTTTLLMGQLLLSIGKNQKDLIQAGCIGIVVASNAGGVFSPFGDLTSLMIWQKGLISFTQFPQLFLPSLISFVIPAFFLAKTITPVLIMTEKAESENTAKNYQSLIIFGLFGITIALTLINQYTFGLPPIFGMILGLCLLGLYERIFTDHAEHHQGLFERMSRIDLDTIFFFYGLILSVEALRLLGALQHTAQFLYQDIPHALGIHSAETGLNIGHLMIGLLSAVVDNIPMMAAVLKMDLQASVSSWQLLAFTTGTGGSLLALGSASGIGLMGIAGPHYDFKKHLHWTPLILLGYLCGACAHLSTQFFMG